MKQIKTQQQGEAQNIFLQSNRYETQQNAVFVDFHKQSMKNSIHNYSNLKKFERISLSKNLLAIKQICAQDPIFFQLLKKCASDITQIKQELILFLTNLKQKRQKNQDLQHIFVNPLIQLINFGQIQIKQKSCLILSQITHILNKKQQQKILQLAINLKDSSDQQNVIISVQILAKISLDMTQQQSKKIFLLYFQDLYSKSSVRIRKQIITNTAIISKNIQKSFLNNIIIQQFFKQKCIESIWGIRKACVQILPSIVAMTDSCKQLLAQILINFLNDGNKIVKFSAFKIIPEFIANYHNPNISQKLISLYVSLIDNQINKLVSTDDEIAYRVSYYFPGVMYTLGASKWPIMVNLFNKLLFSKDNHIRIPIASSLHQISRIIGPQLSKQYMFDALDNILNSGSDIVKQIAISHLSQFVQLFQKSTRQNLIDVFLVLQKDPKKWRIRYQIASQLNTLSKIYESQVIFTYIIPISFKLCNDYVNQVRQKAAQQIYYVIDNIKQSPNLQIMALQSIKGYGQSEKWRQRQTFALMIKNLCKLSCFNQQFQDIMNQLSKDAIINVRIALSISISKAIQQNKQNKQLFKNIIIKLNSDVDEVSQYLK